MLFGALRLKLVGWRQCEATRRSNGCARLPLMQSTSYAVVCVQLYAPLTHFLLPEHLEKPVTYF